MGNGLPAKRSTQDRCVRRPVGDGADRCRSPPVRAAIFRVSPVLARLILLLGRVSAGGSTKGQTTDIRRTVVSQVMEVLGADLVFRSARSALYDTKGKTRGALVEWSLPCWIKAKSYTFLGETRFTR